MSRSRVQTWLALVEMTRPTKPIAAALFTLLGAYLVAPPAQVASLPALSAASVVFLVTAFGLVVNDCYDLAVDRVGKPDRPLPSGRVSMGLAAGFAAFLALAGLAASLSLGWELVFIAFGAVALSWGYSYRLKSTVLFGNASVAVLVVASLIYGALAVGAPGAAVWTAAAVSFPYVTAQEVLFNLEDEDEDRAAGLHTTATCLGGDGTARLIRAILALFIAAALAPWVFGFGSAVYAAAALVFLALPAAFFIYLLRTPLSRTAVVRAAKLSRLVWAASFVPLGLLASGQTAAAGWDDARAVTTDEIITALQSEQKRGYALDAPANSARLQAGVLLALAAMAEAADPQRRALRVGHQEYFLAFLQVTGHTRESAPKFMSVAHSYGEDFLVDYRLENVVAAVRGGRAPKRALSVKAGWPPAAGAPEAYAYEDKSTDPHTEIAHAQLNGYRILDFGDAVVYDDIYGISGRVTSGILGVFFRLLGRADGVQTRLAFTSDGTQIQSTTARKLLTDTRSVTISPDGTVLPWVRGDLIDVERGLVELAFDLVYPPRDMSPMPARR